MGRFGYTMLNEAASPWIYGVRIVRVSTETWLFVVMDIFRSLANKPRLGSGRTCPVEVGGSRSEGWS